MILFALALAATAPTADDARLVTSIVASAVADDSRVDVITQEDVRKAVAVEAERQSLGCSAQSCLAEIASAMGARLVVFGSVGTFDNDIAVEISAFDAETATSLGRAVLNGPSLKAVTTDAKTKAAAFRARALEGVKDNGRLRVLVLDFELRNGGATGASSTAPPTTTSALGVGAIAVSGVSGVALLVGVASDKIAYDALTSAQERDPTTGTLRQNAAEAKSARDLAAIAGPAAIGGYIVGAVTAAVAIGLFVLDGAATNDGTEDDANAGVSDRPPTSTPTPAAR